MSILLTNDDQQFELNKQWRNVDKSTNVLSFPQIEPFAAPSGFLGDISLALETVEREALEQSKSLDDHIAHLVVHGFLHILGYDHEVDDEAERMEKLEINILQKLGLPDPYATLI